MAAGLLERLNALDAEQRLYTLETLVARLRDVGQVDRLRVLFSDDAWLQGRYEGSGGAYDGYRADLDIAWEALAAEADTQVEAGGEISALADCWRLGLIRTSLNSIAGNYPPALVARAIQTGHWSVEKALGVIPGIADLDPKVEICVAVLESDQASFTARAGAQELALDLVSRLRWSEARANWIVRLAPLLDDAHVRALQEIAVSIEEAEDRSPAMAAVAMCLDGPQRDALLDAAVAALESVKPSMGRREVIAEVAPYLSAERAGRAVRAALEISQSPYRVQALAALLPTLADADRDALARQVVEQLWTLDGHDLAFTLGRVLTHLPETVRDEVASMALDRVKDLDDMTQEYDSPRPVAIQALAPHLPAAELERALVIARSMSDGEHLASIKASVLAALAARMTPDARRPVVGEVLASLERQDYVPDKVGNLIELLPLVSGPQRDDILRRALSAAFTLWDDNPNGGLLGAVSPRLKALTGLAPFLSGELLQEGLDNAGVIKDHEKRARTFLGLARLLEGDERRYAMRLSYDAVWTTRNDQMGIFAIETVFAGLDVEAAALAFDGLHALPEQGYPNRWIMAFAALASRLDPPALQSASETISRIDEATDRASGYTALAAYGPLQDRERYQALVLESIAAIPSYAEHLIAYAIRDAAPFLSGAQAEAAWEIVVNLERFERSEAIMAMASRLVGDVALAAFPTIVGLDNPYHRAVGLWRLSAALPEPERSEARSAAFEAAVGMSAEELDAEKAILELIPHLEGAERKRAIRSGLARARYFGNPENGADTFAQLARFMSGRPRSKALGEALERAIRIDDAGKRAEVLAVIFGSMEARGRERALATVLKIEEPNDRFEVLASLAPVLSEPDVPSIRRHIIERLFALREGNRAGLLEFLGHPAILAAPTVPDGLRVRLVHDLDEICSRWSWR